MKSWSGWARLGGEINNNLFFIHIPAKAEEPLRADWGKSEGFVVGEEVGKKCKMKRCWRGEGEEPCIEEL